MSRQSLDNVKDIAGVDPIDVVRSILAESGGLARFMEMHYLAGEPVLFEIMRAIAALEPAKQAALADFLKGAAADGVRIQKVTTEVLELVRDGTEK